MASRRTLNKVLTVINHDTGRIYSSTVLLGKGGFGKCYECTEEIGQAVYALKAIPLKYLNGKEDKTKYEIRLHLKLHHDNIVQLFETFESDGFLYYLLEICCNRSVADILAARCLMEDEIAELFCHLVSGCSYLHGKGLVHRDLKTSNLLIDSYSVLKISDFGLTCSAARSYIERSIVCGTPNYLAPEVLNRMGHSYKSDIWAVAVILYTMFTTRPPFEVKQARNPERDLVQMYQKILQLEYAIPHSIPLKAQQLISSILVFNPHDRPNLEDIRMHEFCTHRVSSENVLRSTPVNKNDRVRGFFKKVISLWKQPSNSGPACLPKNYILKRQQSVVFNDSLTRRGNRLSSSGAKRLCSQSDPSVNVSATYRLKCVLRRLNDASELQRNGDKTVWIKQWMDRSQLSGLYYTLTNGCCGVLYSDTCAAMLCRKQRLLLVSEDNNRKYHQLDAVSAFYQPIVKDLEAVVFTNNTAQNVFLCPIGSSIDKLEIHNFTYVNKWAVHLGNIAFQFDDLSWQFNFNDSRQLRITGRIFHQVSPQSRTSVVVDIDQWFASPKNLNNISIINELLTQLTLI